MDAGERYTAMQQQYPVIKLSLKSAKQPTFALAYGELKKRLAEEFDRHQYITTGEALSEAEIKRYQGIKDMDDNESLYTDAIGFLSRCLAKYHGENVIILIDEYDVPLENAYFRG